MKLWGDRKPKMLKMGEPKTGNEFEEYKRSKKLTWRIQLEADSFVVFFMRQHYFTDYMQKHILITD